MNLIPGVQQDWSGFEYQIGIDAEGKQHRIPYVEENPIKRPEMEKVTVHSFSDLPTKDAEGNITSPQWVLHALASGSLFKRGTVFQSILFFQSRQAG